MLAIPALLGAHVNGPYESQFKPPHEVVVVTRMPKSYFIVNNINIVYRVETLIFQYF